MLRDYLPFDDSESVKLHETVALVVKAQYRFGRVVSTDADYLPWQNHRSTASAEEAKVSLLDHCLASHVVCIDYIDVRKFALAPTSGYEDLAVI